LLRWKRELNTKNGDWNWGRQDERRAAWRHRVKAEITRHHHGYCWQQDSSKFQNNLTGIVCSRFNELSLIARAIGVMRGLLISGRRVPLFVTWRLCIRRRFMNGSSKRFNKARTPALQVKKQKKNERAR